ncbi:TPA: hypothetical protein U9I14_001381 [Streptococcus agalactiae]|uniref:hypothetical protein n=1 Tax=Streptococcus agalactiae TaxID=1311 RepID=UPI0006401B02|nr:hypothetical protein [Streptococcus agalactiae]KLJ51939.1 hypothetical protein WA56_05615 [Streptococcus agalactiae]KLK03544.1 hypothetical protein WB09_03230 [Streptococcus agalactiae]KLK03938.1 hypothetical protein WB10_06285 [Streptococcus agalactiae]KLK17128.1 hypothetical protein WB16_03670 [Streptococcus agalactiae]KLL60736.1 hypothetical protein WA29_05680 [Streptococcus agalactiae]
MKKRLQLLLLIFISAVSWFISNQLATKNTVLSVLIGLVAVIGITWLIVSLLYYLIVKLISVIFHIIENNRTSLDRYKKS